MHHHPIFQKVYYLAYRFQPKGKQAPFTWGSYVYRGSPNVTLGNQTTLQLGYTTHTKLLVV